MSIYKSFGALALTSLLACQHPEADRVQDAPSNAVSSVLDESTTTTHSQVENVMQTVTPEELALEALQQESFRKDYSSRYPGLFGSKLYANEELLSPTFKPAEIYEMSLPSARFLQFFLKNGRDRTFVASEQLGARHHETTLTDSHILTQLFQDAGIDLKGEVIDWVEVDEEMKSGSLDRLSSEYGGRDESILIVARHSQGLSSWIEQPASNAGYRVDPSKEWDSTVFNEMSHEIQQKYFPSLFVVDPNALTEPFKSFRTRIPGLNFKTNLQAAEFLSDVSSWSSGGNYFRFFNPLYYMDSCSEYYRGEMDQYAYSYSVQRYAMQKVLHRKGYHESKIIVDNLIKKACESDLGHNSEFDFARQYFTEEDFVQIGQIYREIGVELLKAMKPYYKNPVVRE